MILITGGQGLSIEDAIEIKGADNSLEGVASEYRHLEQLFGQKDKDWTVVSQSLINENDKYYDQIRIESLNKEQSTIYFNITDFFGKGILF